MYFLISLMPSVGFMIAISVIYLIILVMYKTKTATLLPGRIKPVAQNKNHLVSSDLLPLIDRPFNNLVAEKSHADSNNTNENLEDDFEFIDEQDNLLLKEAENVVERIQDSLNHIAS